MPDERMALVQRLFECFNRRDESCIAELYDESMEFLPAVTSEV